MVRTEYSDFHQRFLQLEEELDLFSIEVDGIPIWERIRSNTALKLLENLGIIGSTVSVGERPLKRYLKGAYLGARNIAVRNPLLAPQSDILCFGRGRRQKEGDEWWDIHFDPLHDALEYDFHQIEFAWNNAHRTPERTPNLSYIDSIYYGAWFCHMSGIVSYEFASSERRQLERLEERIEATFGVSVDIMSTVRQKINIRRVERSLYDMILDRIEPRLAMISVHGTRESFIESCHEYDVPVVEIQHGQISKFSHNYSFPGERTKRTFPDYFLSFDDAWTRDLPLPIDSDRVYSVGYPYIDHQLEKYEHVATEQRLLFISTCETGLELSKLAVEVSERPDVSADVTYKLHPDEMPDWRTEYPWLVDAPVTVIDTPEKSLYELFASSVAQVGVSSTAIYEGVAFGLDTYLYELPTVEWLTPLLDDDLAELVSGPEELAAALATSRTGVRSLDYRPYFRPNSLETIDDVLGELLETATVRRLE